MNKYEQALRECLAQSGETGFSTFVFVYGPLLTLKQLGEAERVWQKIVRELDKSAK